MRPSAAALTILCAVTAALLYSCGNQSEDTSAAVPRQHSYPRPQLYDTVYTAAAELPASFEVNAGATVEYPNGREAKDGEPLWVDIRYPRYGATVNLTFTPVSSMEQLSKALANRRERMALNLGANAAEQTDIQTATGYQSTILFSTGPSLTPLQFLSAGGGLVISGALNMPLTSATPVDSVMPILDAVKADLIHSLQRLK